MWILVATATCAIAGLCGILYCGVCLWALMPFIRRKRTLRGGTMPAVSLLKPLCGLDPQAYENLRSHCVQDYPDFEIIFGVADPEDPILSIVRQLIREFPSVPIKVVVCERQLGMNFKVSNLLQMLPAARHDCLIINDSDIAVPGDYLRRVVAPLADAEVGMVTCLYRGVPASTIGSRLESLGISSDFVPGVLAACRLEGGLRFALGSTMAFRRQTLQAIGGLEPVADYLADDYQLGYRITQAGLRVELSECVVDHCLPAYSLRDFCRHQLRWARTIRGARPGGYAGLVLTFAIPWAALGILAARGAAWSWFLFLLALMLRLVVAWMSGYVALGDRQARRNLWLLPIRDLMAAPIWFASYMDRQVVWRGKKFELSDGKLRPTQS